jgi:regulator of replication initiation timing
MPTPADLRDSLKTLARGVNELTLKNLALELENKGLQRENENLRETLQNRSSTEDAHDVHSPDAPLESPNTADGKDHSRSDSKADKATASEQDPAHAKSSPPADQENQEPTPDFQYWKEDPHDAQYCTQRCLFGLQRHGTLDGNCPNVDLHRRGRTSDMHPIR